MLVMFNASIVYGVLMEVPELTNPLPFETPGVLTGRDFLAPGAPGVAKNVKAAPQMLEQVTCTHTCEFWVSHRF